jgi:hypothetical protein
MNVALSSIPYGKWHGVRKAQIAAFHHSSITLWPQSYAATRPFRDRYDGTSHHP